MALCLVVPDGVCLGRRPSCTRRSGPVAARLKLTDRVEDGSVQGGQRLGAGRTRVHRSFRMVAPRRWSDSEQVRFVGAERVTTQVPSQGRGGSPTSVTGVCRGADDEPARAARHR